MGRLPGRSVLRRTPGGRLGTGLIYRQVHEGGAIVALAVMAGSIYLLSRSLTSLPLGTAYVVWTGIGAVGTVIAGIVLFGESRSVARLLCILLIVSGIVGLKLCSDPSGMSS